MTKEYHVFTNIDEHHEQAFVFQIERENGSIELKELWTITSQKNGEVKSRLHLESMMSNIIQNEGGNIEDKNVGTILDMFKDIIPKTKVQELEQDLLEKTQNSAESLILASEIIAGLSNDSIDLLVKQLLKAKQ